MDASFELILSVASFALAAGGLAVRFFLPSEPAKQVLIAAIFIFLMVILGNTLKNNWKKEQEIRKISEEIINIISNKKLSFEDILLEIRQPNYQIAIISIDRLIESERLGSELIQTKYTQNGEKLTPYVRLYFVRRF